MTVDRDLLDRFHRMLVREIRSSNPEYLEAPFTVAEIYQHLVPYRTHRDELGVQANGEYEEILMHLLAGEGDYLVLDSEPALRRIREELRNPAPNTGLFREFAAAEVRLNPERVVGEHLLADAAEVGAETGEASGGGGAPQARGGAVAGDPATPSLWEGTEEEPPASDPSPPPEAPGSTTPAREPPAPEPPSPSSGNGRVDPVAFGAGAHQDIPQDCPDCAGALPAREGLRFCPFCGVNVHVVACGECQADLERSWNFCIYCGATVG